jgi:hypothetical protein
MRILLLLFFMSHAYGSVSLSPDWVQEASSKDQSNEVQNSFISILEAQGEALDQMELLSSMKIKKTGFSMTEMITDLAVTKSGLLGLSALKSNNGVEIKWKRKASSFLPDESPEIVIDADATEMDIDKISDTVFRIVSDSGKINNTKNVRSSVKNAFLSIQRDVTSIQVTKLNDWRLTALRLDLNFSSSGQLWMFARAGASLRVRMEWKFKPIHYLKSSVVNPHTEFVVKTLDALGKSMQKIPVPGFDARKVSIGVGASQKKAFGLWKASAGFIGFLIFTPETRFLKSMVVLPPDLANQRLILGMEKSLRTAAFFAENSLLERSRHWTIAEIKTINDVSFTGFFGIADFTTKGAVEIDFKRKL